MWRERSNPKVAIPRLVRSKATAPGKIENSYHADKRARDATHENRRHFAPGYAKTEEKVEKGSRRLFTRPGFFPDSASVHEQNEDFMSCKAVAPLHSSSPRPDPSAAMIDPFSSIPSGQSLTRKDQELAHFFISVSPSAVYGPRRSQEASPHNWVRDIVFKEAMKSPMTMQTMVIAFAAAHQAWLRGKKEDSLSVFYQSRAITMLHEHLRQRPKDLSDEAVGSAISLAICEDLSPSFETKKLAMIH
jgi:hypothetical protein